MEHKEIERRFLVMAPPEQLSQYSHALFEQGYLSTDPVLRVRREGEDFVFTYKRGRGLEREEYNLPLTEEAYLHLIKKSDGKVIRKERYFIPVDENLTIEFDVFMGELNPLMIAEVEFDSVEAAKRFSPPGWFGREVTGMSAYANSVLCRVGLPSEFAKEE